MLVVELCTSATTHRPSAACLGRRKASPGTRSDKTQCLTKRSSSSIPIAKKAPNSDKWGLGQGLKARLLLVAQGFKARLSLAPTATATAMTTTLTRPRRVVVAELLSLSKAVRFGEHDDCAPQH
jgi:hypothetical protein